MLPSEKLMLFLELNEVDVSDYLIRRQVEIKDSSQYGAYKINSIKKLLEFIYEENTNLENLKNPLAYQNKRSHDIEFLEFIKVSHPDLEKKMPLYEFLKLTSFNIIQKESILFDVLDEYVSDYRESTNALMNIYEQMTLQLPSKQKRYKKPSFIKFLIALFLSIFLLLVYQNSSSAFTLGIGYNIHQLMIELPWYNTILFITTFLFVFYAVASNIFVQFIKNINKEKKIAVKKYFKKWNAKLDQKRLKQAGLLEDYVDEAATTKNKLRHKY